MCQVSHSNGSMTLLIWEVADMPRHPSTRILSKAVFWRGTAHAGSSLSCKELNCVPNSMFSFLSHKWLMVTVNSYSTYHFLKNIFSSDT